MVRSKKLDLIRDFQNLIPKVEGINRDIESSILASIGSKPVKVISGFRRAGKSFLVMQILKKLLEQKYCELENILYLNFENLNLAFVKDATDLNELYKLYLSDLSPSGGEATMSSRGSHEVATVGISSRPNKQIIVLDEIQNVKDWDKFVRTIYENKSITNQSIEIIITGSNSELLSSELSSSLAGRFVEFFVLPFAFSEFLRYRDIEIKSKKELQRHRIEVENLLYEYLRYGSLPEVFSINDPNTKYSYIEGVISKVILDDVISRFNVKHSELIEKILHYLISNLGAKLSYSKLTNHIKSLGYDVKQDTIVDYVHYLEKSFALFELAKFDWKSQSVFSGNKKYYAIDTGVANFYKGLTDNFSRQIENLVYLNLVKKFQIKNIFYGNDDREIDFIVKRSNREQIFDKYQVCVELNDENYKGEISAFAKTDQYLGSGENILITLESHDYEIENVKCYELVEWLVLGKK